VNIIAGQPSCTHGGKGRTSIERIGAISVSINKKQPVSCAVALPYHMDRYRAGLPSCSNTSQGIPGERSAVTSPRLIHNRPNCYRGLLPVSFDPQRAVQVAGPSLTLLFWAPKTPRLKQSNEGCRVHTADMVITPGPKRNQ
jgi:hypothetical protein